MARSIVAALLVVLAATSGLDASTFVPVADEDLVDEAAAIAEIRVLGVSPDRQGELPRTRYDAEVLRWLKGGDGAAALAFGVIGGARADGLTWRVPGAPRFDVGEEALVFLERGPAGLRLLHLAQGAFRLARFGVEELLVRDLAASTAIDPDHRAVRRRPSLLQTHLPRRRGAFLKWIGDRVRGALREPDYYVEPGARQALAEFTLFTRPNGLNIRWPDFDAGQSVTWYLSRKQPGVRRGGRNDVIAALAAWSRLGNIELVFGGRRAARSGTTAPDDLNVILMNDPDDVISAFSCVSGGTLAIGGPWFFDQGQHVKNGKTYISAIEGDVVFNDGLGCAFRASPDRRKLIEEVAAHELGHTLGLDHSCGAAGSPGCEGRRRLDRALMRAFAHDDARGAAIMRDDRRGALSPKGLRYRGVDVDQDSR